MRKHSISSSRSNSRERSRQLGEQNNDRKLFRQQLLQKYKRSSSQESKHSIKKIIVKQKIVVKPPVVKSDKSDDSLDMFNDIDIKAHNNPTDHESYYRIVNGEVLNKKYKIIETLGKGMFGNVVKVLNIEEDKEYAIKILRNNEMIMKSGEKEYNILKKINNQYVIKCYGAFMHKSHYCLVFELLAGDLRARIGEKLFTLDEVKKYSIQLFVGLHAIRKQKWIHADIKPDNFLFSKDKESVKICDFGTALSEGEANIVEYLVARYYRAPQIILGCNIDYSIDVWSIGCTLYQMVTGQFLFPGRDNNEVLKYIIQTRGKISLKMLRKGEYTSKHFDKNNNFILHTVDPITLQVNHKSIDVPQDRELLKLIKAKNGEDSKKQVLFKDFLERCLTLNPKNRLTPDEALKHPFLNYQIVLN